MPHTNAVGYFITGYELDTWKQIGVFFNPNDETLEIKLPSSEWVIVVDTHHAGLQKLHIIRNGLLTLLPHTHCVLVDAKSFNLL